MGKYDKFDPKWITGEVPIDDDVIEWTKNFGKKLSPKGNDKYKPLTTSQIRKFFGEVKRIQASFDKHKDDIPLLNAKLAYAVGRNSYSRIEYLYNELESGIKAINGNQDNYNRFVNIVESIVAFHKFHGGKD